MSFLPFNAEVKVTLKGSGFANTRMLGQTLLSTADDHTGIFVHDVQLHSLIEGYIDRSVEIKGVYAVHYDPATKKAYIFNNRIGRNAQGRVTPFTSIRLEHL